MRKLFRIIFIIIALIAVIVIAGVALFLAKPDVVTKKGVVEVLSYVLKTDVKLDSADVSLSEGKCELKDLVINSPEGFNTKEAFSVGRVNVEFSPKIFNIMKPEIQGIMVENPQINLEINTKGSNLGQLSKNASRLEKWKFKRIGDKVKIRKIIVDGAKVSMATTKFKDKTVSFGLHRIEMDNLGGENGITVAGVIKAFFEKILKESLKSGREYISKLGDEAAIKGLRDAISELPELKDKTGEAVKEGVKGLKDDVKDMLGQ